MRASPLDLAALLLAALLLMGLTVAGRQAAQEASTAIRCADNLRRLGNGLRFYQDQNAGTFPRTRYEAGRPITAYSNWQAPDPFAATGPAVNDVTTPFYLLAREVDLAADVFVCPAAFRNGLSEVWDFTPENVRAWSNFNARIHLNYSVANPYPSAAAVAAGYDINRPPPGFALMADTNAGDEALERPVAPEESTRKGLRMTNSPNHERDGQNVLLADGSVGFYPAAFVGPAKENIYASSGIFPDPAGRDDAVLLPTWKTGPDLIPARTQNRKTVFLWASIVTLVGLSLIVWRGVRRGRAERDPAPSFFR